MEYLHWDEKTITDFSDANIEKMYSDGFLFTRKGRGVMQKTRSVRIDLSKFTPSSENRRILKKVADLKITKRAIPLPDYSWEIGKLAKDFYDTKFGEGIFSANKIKSLLTSVEETNFNTLYTFGIDASNSTNPAGFCIAFENKNILHYSYPFYNLETAPKDMGLGMMTLALSEAKSAGLKYVYLGSLQRPTDTYKLQFEGIEWFDGERWQADTEAVKEILKA